jgi:hypothetical protein
MPGIKQDFPTGRPAGRVQQRLPFQPGRPSSQRVTWNGCKHLVQDMAASAAAREKTPVCPGVFLQWS